MIRWGTWSTSTCLIHPRSLMRTFTASAVQDVQVRNMSFRRFVSLHGMHSPRGSLKRYFSYTGEPGAYDTLICRTHWKGDCSLCCWFWPQVRQWKDRSAAVTDASGTQQRYEQFVCGTLTSSTAPTLENSAKHVPSQHCLACMNCRDLVSACQESGWAFLHVYTCFKGRMEEGEAAARSWLFLLCVWSDCVHSIERLRHQWPRNPVAKFWDISACFWVALIRKFVSFVANQAIVRLDTRRCDCVWLYKGPHLSGCCVLCVCLPACHSRSWWKECCSIL